MRDSFEPDPLRRAWLALTTAAERGQGCPDAARIWEAQRGDLTCQEVQEIIQHTVTCPGCAEAWRLARDMGAMQAREQPARTAFWRLRPFALAAALACMSILGVTAVWLWLDHQTPEVDYRSVGQDRIRALVSEEQPLPRAACRLRWTPGPAGSRYTIQVAKEDYEQVSFAKGLAEAEYLVPAGDLKELPSGTRLMWQVQALLPDGDLDLSETFFFVID